MASILRSNSYSILSIPWHHRPLGWALMVYRKRGKDVCRYFYPEESK